MASVSPQRTKTGAQQELCDAVVPRTMLATMNRSIKEVSTALVALEAENEALQRLTSLRLEMDRIRTRLQSCYNATGVKPSEQTPSTAASTNASAPTTLQAQYPLCCAMLTVTPSPSQVESSLVFASSRSTDGFPQSTHHHHAILDDISSAQLKIIQRCDALNQKLTKLQSTTASMKNLYGGLQVAHRVLNCAGHAASSPTILPTLHRLSTLLCSTQTSSPTAIEGIDQLAFRRQLSNFESSYLESWEKHFFHSTLETAAELITVRKSAREAQGELLDLQIDIRRRWKTEVDRTLSTTAVTTNRMRLSEALSSLTETQNELTKSLESLSSLNK
jgi:hypothetical protein